MVKPYITYSENSESYDIFLATNFDAETGEIDYSYNDFLKAVDNGSSIYFIGKNGMKRNIFTLVSLNSENSILYPYAAKFKSDTYTIILFAKNPNDNMVWDFG